ncbi:zincin-like metallopeptidase domain-containing protein, partial [bacterium]|nr:zincin-like metallopeptidase domain-containing protein [bacterium]
GINPFILNCKAMQCGFESNFWLTRNQIKKIGGEINIDEMKNSTAIIFWKWIKATKNEDDESDQKLIPLLRYYRVYNLDQTSLKRDKEEMEVVSNVSKDRLIDVCEAVVEGYKNKPQIFYKGDRAFYRPSKDEVFIPQRDKFECIESFYGVLFHELAHSTGHRTRLNRVGIESNNHMFGDSVYSKEELVAEMASSFLCGVCGIGNKALQSSASYIESWLKVLKSDHKILIISAAQAQKAADLIVNKGAYGPLFFF